MAAQPEPETDPVERAFATAPLDDEPLAAAERAELERARAEPARPAQEVYTDLDLDDD